MFHENKIKFKFVFVVEKYIIAKNFIAIRTSDNPLCIHCTSDNGLSFYTMFCHILTKNKKFPNYYLRKLNCDFGKLDRANIKSM